ncbi:MAG: 6-hydroxymethylpterin diphosphokinase MptE-like protein [Chlamydiota bacterium]|nr:6-hydroxymethylpterin diphosphokinase MptE-like protein [Chlamydiota bacterium]
MAQLLDENLFHENIHLWSLVNPKKALRLQYLHENKIEFCESSSGDKNLIAIKDGKQQFYHDQTDPKNEAHNWFKSLDLNAATVIYVYGVGLGYYYDAAKEWLAGDSNRSIVFLEDDPQVIHCLFQTKRGGEILKNQQATLFLFSSLYEEEDAFEELYWDFVMTQMTISALIFYEKTKEEKFLDLKHKIVHDAAIKNALVEEYLHYGVSFFRNFYPNMLTLSESWKGTHLYGKFENVPAIICGAGPSLEKNIEEVRKYLDNAIVFGGGSALNALSSRDILPHFGIGIDPNPTQQYRLSSNKAYEVSLFYRNRMHHEAYGLVHGPRLYIPGAGGYEVADWFDEKFGLLEDIEWLDEGHNVVNFGLELAKNLGCNPIIFVGVDLAYTEMQSYASGIIDDTAVEKNDILNTGDFDTTALLKTDIYGKPIYTLWKWMAESEWTGEYAKAHPELTLINSTEGGLGLEGVPNIPFKEVAEKYLQRSFDLRSRVQGEILSSAMPEITDDSVIAVMEDLCDSLRRSIDHVQVLIGDKERYEQQLKESRAIPTFTQSGLAALAEIELEEEPAYEYILGIFNLVYSRILNKEIQRASDENSSLKDWERELTKNIVNRKRLKFMHDVAAINVQIIESSLEERYAKIKG